MLVAPVDAAVVHMRRLVGTNLIIPHIVGNSGVLRNFSAYFAQLIDVQGKTDLQVLYLPTLLACISRCPGKLEGVVKCP